MAAVLAVDVVLLADELDDELDVVASSTCWAASACCSSCIKRAFWLPEPETISDM
jgi:hypothetical protein